MTPIRTTLCALAGASLIACAASPDEGANSSSAVSSGTRLVNVSLEGPTSWLVDHTQSVVFALSYTDESLSTTELFPRSDLAMGIASKPYNVRSDVAVKACTFTWTVMDRPTGAPAGVTRALLKPVDFDGLYHGTCKVEDTAVSLRLPWVMSTVAIDLPASALDAHGAKGVIGQMTVDGTSPKFSMGYATSAASWAVDVLSLPGAKRTASLTWVLRTGHTAQTTTETTDDHLSID